jgi:hypothetical protein
VPVRSEGDDAFLDARRKPRLTRCAVLFLDLLGVRAMNQGPPEEVQQRLEDLDRAVTGTFRDILGPDAPRPAAFFSDTLVLASPLDVGGDEEAAVTELLLDAARLQLDLLTAGFFARGGLSLGLFHVREGLIFGPALVEAYELEDLHAVHPRVVLSKEAEAVIPRPSSQLLCDGDGWTFINYLDPLLEEPDDPVPVLQAHRDRVLAGLRLNRDRKRVWEKCRWVAEYHNAFVDRAVLEGRLGAAEDVGIPALSMTWRFAPFD